MATKLPAAVRVGVLSAAMIVSPVHVAPEKIPSWSELRHWYATMPYRVRTMDARNVSITVCLPSYGPTVYSCRTYNGRSKNAE